MSNQNIILKNNFDKILKENNELKSSNFSFKQNLDNLKKENDELKSHIKSNEDENLAEENEKLKEEIIKRDELLEKYELKDLRINELEKENKNLIKKNMQLTDENEIMKQEIENKEKIKEHSLISQDEGDNNEQKISKLKKENEKLKIIENKYNIMEKEYEEYKKENELLKKDNEYMKLQLDSLKSINNPKPFTPSIVKTESFEIVGVKGEDDDVEEVYFDNGNIPPQFLQNQNANEEGDYGEEEGEDQIDFEALTDEQKQQVLLQMQMQQMQQNGEEGEYIDENGEHYIINNGENEEEEIGENYEEFNEQGNDENVKGVEFGEIEEEQNNEDENEEENNNNEDINKNNNNNNNPGDENGLDFLGDEINKMGL